MAKNPELPEDPELPEKPEPGETAAAGDEATAAGDEAAAAGDEAAARDGESAASGDEAVLGESARPRKPGKNRSLLTLSGWLITAISFALGIVLIIAESLFSEGNPYTGLVTYILIPMTIGFGLFLVVLGTFLSWRRRKKRGNVERHLPVIDLNSRSTRRRILIASAATTTFFAVSTVATYRAFLYTESTEFCGTLCHEIMKPEYVAYQHSPHARVPCVDCHIGHGADWYVKSKVSGLRQAYKTVRGTYELPIQVPITNLRPARDTCEQCHWPAKFTGSLERVEWHYWFDQESTPSRFHLLMRIGGLNPQSGEPEGIHWHTSSSAKVSYWASDRQRLDIPYIEVEQPDGSRTVYRDSNWQGEAPDQGDMRRMDCIDCHNRPAHIYKPPAAMVNTALAAGRLNRHIPLIKRNAVEILSIDYPSTKIARAKIAEEVERRFPVGSDALITPTAQEELTAALIEYYELNHFPEQGISWKTYPNHIGHRVFPGCFRCHDDRHVSDSGKKISMECDLCHDLVYQAYGDAADDPVKYRTQEFQHPGGVPDMHKAGYCTDCHSADAAHPGHAAGKRDPVRDYPRADADAGPEPPPAE
jgi:nitrate/TMAO reductase-like tetraheme cytochrome c subunit